MQLFDLIQANPLIWALLVFYLVATSALAWMGHKKTSDLESFALGKGDMNPIVVGITLASSIASSATFIINPGFVYAHGLSALIALRRGRRPRRHPGPHLAQPHGRAARRRARSQSTRRRCSNQRRAMSLP